MLIGMLKVNPTHRSGKIILEMVLSYNCTYETHTPTTYPYPVNSPSSEIGDEDNQNLNIKCPICKAGNILPRKSGISNGGSRSRYVFYGCSNFEYSCKYKFTKFEGDPGWIEDDFF